MRSQPLSILLLATALLVGFAPAPSPTSATPMTSPTLSAGHTDKPERLIVHGRLKYYIGTPTARIWIIGTKRLLGVRESGDGSTTLPKELCDLMAWDRELFADFIVEPLTPSKPGVMQMVRVLSASGIVVTEHGKVVVRPIERGHTP